MLASCGWWFMTRIFLCLLQLLYLHAGHMTRTGLLLDCLYVPYGYNIPFSVLEPEQSYSCLSLLSSHTWLALLACWPYGKNSTFSCIVCILALWPEDQSAFITKRCGEENKSSMSDWLKIMQAFGMITSKLTNRLHHCISSFHNSMTYLVSKLKLLVLRLINAWTPLRDGSLFWWSIIAFLSCVPYWASCQVTQQQLDQ